MNYIGSKLKLLPFLHSTINNVVGLNNLSNCVFCDGFAGTGIVGRSFKKSVKKVISNDLEYYSYVLNRNYIGNNTLNPIYSSIIEDLNRLELKEGFIYKNYCLGGNGERMYFSDNNGKKIDAIRIKIEELKNSKAIDEDAYFFLLCSLLESADKVANTASVYGAFLKKIKKTAEQDLVLTATELIESNTKSEVFNEDLNLLIKKIEGDILYLDPPYNARQYGANYHMLNTIAEYKHFNPMGKTGMRVYERSKYCAKNQVANEFDNLIKDAKFKFIFLSYNNEGLMSLEDVESIMSKYGHYSIAQTNYQRFKADKTENRNHKADSTIEYIHILEKE